MVVPVRDRPDALDGLLSSLGPFRDAGAGLVVVDDGSVDGPAHERVSQRHGATYIRRDRSGGPGVARDDGIATVTTPLVAIVDSDCVVPAGAGRWWEPLLRLFDDDRVAAVAPRVRTPPGPALLARYEGIRSPLDMGADPARVNPGTRVSYVPAAALVLRELAHPERLRQPPERLEGQARGEAARQGREARQERAAEEGPGEESAREEGAREEEALSHRCAASRVRRRRVTRATAGARIAR